jgi:hypothetical protein
VEDLAALIQSPTLLAASQCGEMAAGSNAQAYETVCTLAGRAGMHVVSGQGALLRAVWTHNHHIRCPDLPFINTLTSWLVHLVVHYVSTFPGCRTSKFLHTSLSLHMKESFEASERQEAETRSAETSWNSTASMESSNPKR